MKQSDVVNISDCYVCKHFSLWIWLHFCTNSVSFDVFRKSELGLFNNIIHALQHITNFEMFWGTMS